MRKEKRIVAKGRGISSKKGSQQCVNFLRSPGGELFAFVVGDVAVAQKEPFERARVRVALAQVRGEGGGPGETHGVVREIELGERGSVRGCGGGGEGQGCTRHGIA